jgi:hypothetical protein
MFIKDATLPFRLKNGKGGGISGPGGQNLPPATGKGLPGRLAGTAQIRRFAIWHGVC